MVEKLRLFNDWLDEFLIELSMPLLLIGLTMATVDLLLRGRMATQLWFEVPWAIVQAVAIDGLFFAIWLRFFREKWSWARIAILLAGIIMAIVAAIVNDILSYQQVNNIADSLMAMRNLQPGWLFNPATFTTARAILVIFVAILIIPFRSHMAMVTTQKATTSIAKRPRPNSSIAISELPKEPPKELPEKVGSHMEKAKELSKEEQCIAKWLASDQGHGVKKAIALELGIGYSTVKKYIAEREKATMHE